MKSKTFKDLNVGDNIYLFSDLHVVKFKINGIDESGSQVNFVYDSFPWNYISVPKSEMMNTMYEYVFSDINAIFNYLNNNL